MDLNIDNTKHMDLKSKIILGLIRKAQINSIYDYNPSTADKDSHFPEINIAIPDVELTINNQSNQESEAIK